MPRIGARGPIYQLEDGILTIDPYYAYEIGDKRCKVRKNLLILDRIVKYFSTLPLELRMYAIPSSVLPRIDYYSDDFLAEIALSLTKTFTIARHFAVRLSLKAETLSIKSLKRWAGLLNTAGYYGSTVSKWDTFSIDVKQVIEKVPSRSLASLLTNSKRPLLVNPSYSDALALELKRTWQVVPKVLISSNEPYNFLKMHYPLALEWHKAGIDIEFDAACSNVATIKLYNWIQNRLA